MLDWMLVYEGFDPERERLREALCTLGNGYFATRGAGEEAAADDIHYPGTYLAGGYNRLDTEIAGRVIENEDLVNLPNWLCLTFQPEDGDWLDLRAVEILSYRQTLHLKHGVLARRLRFRDRQGRETTLLSRRFVHMANPHLAAIETILTPENWSGRIRVRSALDSRSPVLGKISLAPSQDESARPPSSQPARASRCAKGHGYGLARPLYGLVNVMVWCRFLSAPST